MDGKLSQQPFWDELLSAKSLIAFGVATVPLAVCYLWWLPSYNKAIERNADVHERSPLFPLFDRPSIIIQGFYPTMIIIVILFGMCGILPEIDGFIIGAIFYTFGIEWMATQYQTLIALISIYRFFNNRRSPDLRRDLTREALSYMMYYVCAVLFVSLLLESLALIPVIVHKAKREVIYRGFVIYIPQQILLFIAMAFQFSMKSVPAISYSENNVIIQTKIIGLVKFVLFIIAGISFITGIETTVALIIYFYTDIFLVAVVIEITEVRSNPNAF